MNVKVGDTVIIPGGKDWTGQRGKIIEISQNRDSCKVDVNGYVVDVWALDVSLPEPEATS
jgi:ribosomal protein L24